MDTGPQRIAKAYDMVLNGWELGGGSVYPPRRRCRPSSSLRFVHGMRKTSAPVDEKQLRELHIHHAVGWLRPAATIKRAPWWRRVSQGCVMNNGTPGRLCAVRAWVVYGDS